MSASALMLLFCHRISALEHAALAPALPPRRHRRPHLRARARARGHALVLVPVLMFLLVLVRTYSSADTALQTFFELFRLQLSAFRGGSL